MKTNLKTNIMYLLLNNSEGKMVYYKPQKGDKFILHRKDDTMSFGIDISSKRHSKGKVVWHSEFPDDKIIIEGLSLKENSKEEQEKKFLMIVNVLAESHGLTSAEITLNNERLLHATLN